jgi:signal transduction histidine kinase
MRLRARLILLIGIAAGPALALLIRVQLNSHASEIDNAQRKAEEAARAAALYSDASIQSLRQSMAGLHALLPRFQRDPQLCDEFAGRLSGFGPATVFGAFYENHWLCGSLDPAASLPGWDGRILVPSPKAPAGAEAASGEAPRPAAFTLVEPGDTQGGAGSFVAANVSAEWLNRTIGRYPLDMNTTVMLVDREGTVLARRPDPEPWVGKRIPGEVWSAVRDHAETIRDSVGLGLHSHIIAAAPLPSVPRELFALVGIDRDAALAHVNRAGLRNAALLGLIAIAVFASAAVSWETAGAITRRENRLIEAKAAAERVSAGQQRIADTIGHDLRNSVQTLVSFLRNLRRNSERPPDPAMIPYVARAVGDLRSSLDILIRASRLESGALEPRLRPVQLATLLEKIANDWRFYADTKGLALRVAAGPETIDTDPDLLRTIVANLVSNAIKHTDSGGVSVATASDTHGRVVISVEDTGKGIPLGKAKLIFEAFARLEPDKTDGLGLGLSIAKRSADLLGCEVTLDQDVASGCRFVVRLGGASEAQPPGRDVRGPSGAER